MSKKSIKIQNNLTCDVSGNSCNNRHILRKPRKLPCGKTVCLECAEVSSDSKNSFQCFHCKRTHCLIKDLSRNMMTEYALDENLPDLCAHFLNELRKSCLKIKEISLEKKLTLINVIEFVSSDITIRAESVDVELEKLKISLGRDIDWRANKLVEKSQKKFQECSDRLHAKPRLKPIDLIHFYEKLIRQLATINSQFSSTATLLKASELKSPTQIQTSDLLGQLKWADKSVYNIEKPFQSRSIRLKFHPYDISLYLNDTFIATDRQGDCLYLLNRKLSRILRKVEQIGVRKELIQPTNILVDSKKQLIYLCCSKSKSELDETEILISKIDLSEVLCQVPNDTGLILIDFCLTRDGNLFVFNSHKNSIFTFYAENKKLEFLFKLDTENEINQCSDRPFGLSFTDELVAVNFSNKFVNIYNLKNKLLDSKISINTAENGAKIYGIYLEKTTSRLFIHLNDAEGNSQIRCFQKFSSNWACVLEKELLNVNTGSWRIKFINECLFLTLWSQNLFIC
jgi:hypothetical protein